MLPVMVNNRFHYNLSTSVKADSFLVTSCNWRARTHTVKSLTNNIWTWFSTFSLKKAKRPATQQQITDKSFPVISWHFSAGHNHYQTMMFGHTEFFFFFTFKELHPIWYEGVIVEDQKEEDKWIKRVGLRVSLKKKKKEWPRLTEKEQPLSNLWVLSPNVVIDMCAAELPFASRQCNS